jgi:ParB-like chromosome segregation protein Spo0J/DNA modification methylase
VDVREIEIAKIIVKDRYRIEKGDIESLAKTLSEKGQIQPISVDQNMKLLAGERRLLAAKHLGWTKIFAIVRRVSDKVDALEIELLENIARKDMTWKERARLEEKIFEYKSTVDPNWTQRKQAEFTGDALGVVNKRLQLAGALDLLPELGQYENEIDAFKAYKRLEEGMVLDMMKAKVPAHVLQAVEKAAEHYHVGDAFEGMAHLPDASFHFAEVDPPYGVDLHNRRVRNEDSAPMESYVEWSDFEEKFTRTAQEVYRLLRPHSFAVFWYGMSWHTQVADIIRQAGFAIPDIPAVWFKGNAGQTASPDTTWGSCYEPFFLARKGQPKLAKPGRGNVFHFPPLAQKVHATEKPLLLIKEILGTILLPGSNILCPFLGSGATLRAAYRLGHTGLGWDLSQEHKQGFLRRVEEDQKEKEKKDAAEDDAT